MPIVGYKCEEHGYFDTFHSMDEKYEARCETCGKKAQRVWAPIPFKLEFKAGWDMGLGQNVESQRQRDNILGEKGLRRIKD